MRGPFSWLLWRPRAIQIPLGLAVTFVALALAHPPTDPLPVRAARLAETVVIFIVALVAYLGTSEKQIHVHNATANSPLTLFIFMVWQCSRRWCHTWARSPACCRPAWSSTSGGSLSSTGGSAGKLAHTFMLSPHPVYAFTIESNVQ